MGKKRNKSSKPSSSGTQPEPATNSGGSSARWIALGLLVLGTGVFLYALSSETPTPSTAHSHSQTAATSSQSSARQVGQPVQAVQAAEAKQYRYFENAEDAHPLPVTLPPSKFQDPRIANAYAIAKEIPEVLAQQPCLCGCDNPSDDHRSLLDCYIDGHAATCMVCMKEAVFAKQRTEAGESGASIRDAILRHEFSSVNIGVGG